MKMKKTAFAAIAAAAAAFAQAREITSFTLSQSGEDLVANVAFTAGETGDNHVLYIAYASAEMGETLYAWANDGGVMEGVQIADDATSADVTLSSGAKAAAALRAFLVKKTGVTPAYDPDNNTIREKIRSGNGLAWFITDYFCTGEEAISIAFEGIYSATTSYHPFGFRDGTTSAPNATIDVYNDTSKTSWAFAQLNSAKTAIAWQSSTSLPASAAKTELVFDIPGRKYTATAGGETKEYTIGSGVAFLMTGVEKASVPLTLLACNNNSADGKKAVGNLIAPTDSFIYGASIKCGGEYKRCYIPVTGVDSCNGKELACGLLWDAVENKLVGSYSATADTYQKSRFFTNEEGSTQTAEVDFHAAVPAELQTKYETIVASLSAGRKIVSLKVKPGQNAPVATVETTPCSDGSTSRLYIAWGTEDLGEDIVSWGDNIYDAGTMSGEETEMTVSLPAGIYPRRFRAFAVRDVAQAACDSPVEFIMVKNDAKSFIQTDYSPAPKDKYLASYHLPDDSTDTCNDRVLFAGGHADKTDTTGTQVSVYMQPLSGSLSWRHLLSNGAGSADADWTNTSKERANLAVKAGNATLMHDGSDDEHTTIRITYPDLDETLESKGVLSPQKGTAVSTSTAYPLAIFNNGRSTKTTDWDNANMPAGTKLYSFSISNVVDSVTVLGRHYVPAVKDGEYGVWEAVENKFFPGKDGYAFATTNSTGGAISTKAVFHALADADLLAKYMETESSLGAVRTGGLVVRLR